MESEEDIKLLIEIKGNYVMARTEMLQWIFRYRMKARGASGERRSEAVGLCSQPDSAFGS